MGAPEKWVPCNLKHGWLDESLKLRNEILRGHWRDFRSGSMVSDRAQIFQCFARADVRETAGYRPSRPHPLFDTELGTFYYTPADKANLLGRHFADKQTATVAGKRSPVKSIRETINAFFPARSARLLPSIGLTEIRLASRDLPNGKALGPDIVPRRFIIVAWRRIPSWLTSSRV